MHWAVA